MRRLYSDPASLEASGARLAGSGSDTREQLSRDGYITGDRLLPIANLEELVGRVGVMNGARSEEERLAPSFEERNVGRVWEHRRLDSRYRFQPDGRNIQDLLDGDLARNRGNRTEYRRRAAHRPEHDLGLG